MVTYWYTVLPAHDIINICGPEHDPVGWTPEIIEARKKKTEHRVMYTNNKKGFFTKLEKSILENGFINPIIVVRGYLTEKHLQVEPGVNVENFMDRIHPDHHNRLDTLLTCPRNGGSRLYLAQKHNMDIPCIVNDFTGGFNDGRQLFTYDDILNCYNDTPANLTVNEAGMFITGLPHIHMSNYKTYITKFTVVPALEIDNDIQPDSDRIGQLEEECGFFSKLEKSILAEGFRNPVVLTALNGKLTPRYGGSRIMIAQKYGMDIPAIVADFDGRFPDAEVLSDANKIRAKFKDLPKSIHYKPQGINISGCQDTHLDE